MSEEETDTDNCFECDDCGGVFNGEPARTSPPSYNSPDGLGRAYCERCSNARVEAERGMERDMPPFDDPPEYHESFV